MHRSSTLYGVSFGKDDAAMDAKQGFLDKVFLKTSFYHRVRTGQKFLVTGRKGSGKTAICLSLKNALEAEGKLLFLQHQNSYLCQKCSKLRVHRLMIKRDLRQVGDMCF